MANTIKNGTSAQLGVMFCHAFGEERQKTYRSTFHFSTLLAQHHIPSFRFDYLGSGDSDGNLSDISLDTMLANSLHAAEIAKTCLGCDRLIILGIRLGAVIAARAASQIPAAIATIMWNPIVNGAEYLRELKRTEKLIRLSRPRGITPPISPPANSAFTVIEADLMTSEFTTQIESTDLVSEAMSMSRLFVAGREDDEKEASNIRRLVDAKRSEVAQLECWLQQPREFWSTRSMYDAYFPVPTFEQTLHWIESIRLAA